ncbi:pat-6 [Pristionchus pacificus]|nr:pat-6 [Pristionchus pacificus]
MLQSQSAANRSQRGTPGPSDTLRSKKSESFVDKLAGTLTRKKKPQPEGERDEENEALEIEQEGRDALEACIIPTLAKDVRLDEGEERRFLTAEAAHDPRFLEVIRLLIHWLNDELASERIVIKHIQEDLYDGQVLQKLLEKLQNIKIEVPEVSQSEEGQRQKLQMVVQTANRLLQGGAQHEQPKWTAEQIHGKDIIAITQMLIALALHYRAPIRFPEHVSAGAIIAVKQNGQTLTRTVNEPLTTTQTELGLKGERDAFDTLFDYGPDKLAHVKTSLLAFCNKHLNKINLEVTDLESQFQDGVFLILLMGLLEGYFVPLHCFQLQVSSYEGKLRNVGFAFKLMQDAGLPKPRSRAADIANGDLKCTLRLLHQLFTKYKHV